MADNRGTPKTKVSTAPVLAARQHERRFSQLTLWFLLVPPRPQIALGTPSIKVLAHTKVL
jgi:hypothetical protein